MMVIWRVLLPLMMTGVDDLYCFCCSSDNDGDTREPGMPPLPRPIIRVMARNMLS